MPETTNDNPPIIRYILWGLVFVLIFVGIAYLAYRLSRGGEQVVTQPTPTPTATVPPSTGPNPITQNPYIIPPPVSQPVDPRPKAEGFLNTPRPVAPIAKIDGVTVAQDGRGNLLFNNLTHEEFFQLEMARLRANQELALARLQQEQQTQAQRQATQAQLEQAKLQSNLQAQQSAAQAALQAEAIRAQQQQQAANQAFQLAQLRSQERQAIANQTATTTQQLAQNKLQQETIYYQYAAQANQLATQSNLAAREQELRLTQLSLAEKQQYAALAHERAMQTQSYGYALVAQKLQADLARAQQAAQAHQTAELLRLQAQIEANMLILSRQLTPYTPYAGYSNFGGYGMPYYY